MEDLEVVAFDAKSKDFPIESVTVFVDSGNAEDNFAEVVRVTKIGPPAGLVQVVIEGLPKTVKHDSVRAELASQGAAKILEVSTEKRTVLIKETKLENELKQLQLEKNVVNAEINRNSERSAFFNRYAQSIIDANVQSPEQGAPISEKLMDNTTLEEVKGFLEFHGKQLESCMEKAVQLVAVRTTIEKRINALQIEIANSKLKRDTEENVVTILLDVQQADAELNMSVFYIVTNAFWRASYDARAQKAANRLHITYYGEVENNSGEDWKAVNLALSTAKPSEAGTLEPLPKATVSFGTSSPTVNPSTAARRRRMSENMNEEVMSNRVQPRELLAPIGLQQQQLLINPEEVEEEGDIATAGVESGSGATSFHINRLATILSDGKAHKQTIGKYELQPTFSYAASPKMSPYVYLKCATKNTSGTPFLGGAVAVFIDGSFIAYSSIAGVSDGEDFGFFLGIDQNVKLEWSAETKKDENLSAGILITKKSKERRSSRKIKVTNSQDRDIVVTLYLQVPVAEDADIDVTLIKPDVKKSKRGVTHTLKNNILQSKTTVKKNSSWTMDFKYLITWNNVYTDVVVTEKTLADMQASNVPGPVNARMNRNKKMKARKFNNARFAMQEKAVQNLDNYNYYMA